MAKLFNGARMTSATTGVAGTATTMTLGAAVGGYLSFSGAGVADGDVVTYGISDGTAFEVGRGTYTAAGTTLSRTTIIKSTNSNLAIALSGSQQVYVTAAAEDVVGTSSANPFFGFGPAHNLQINATVATNALTIALKTNAGADATETTPIQIPFRDSTIANGGPLWRQVKAALSVVVPSGQALGTANNVPFHLWIVALDNAGTVELAVINCVVGGASPTQIVALAEHALQSTTAIATAPSAGVFYSTTARTSKAIAILGYVEYASGLATAGTYASAPTETQLYGPGIKKPGDVVGVAFLSKAAISSFTSSTAATTNTTKAITLTSAANLVLASWGGMASSGNAAASAVLAQLARGSTLIGPQIVWDGPSSLAGQMSDVYLDAPGSTSATYAVFLSSQDNVTTVNFGNGSTGRILLQELMS